MEKKIVTRHDSQEEVSKLHLETKGIIEQDASLKKEVYSLTTSEEVVERSYAAIRRYYEQNKVCENCKGYFDCKKLEDKGLIKKLVLDAYAHCLDDVFVKCKYYQAIYDIFQKFIYTDFQVWNSYTIHNKVILALKNNASKVENSFVNTGKIAIKNAYSFKEDQINRGMFISSSNSNANNLVLGLAFYLAKNGKTVSCVDAKTTLTDCGSLNKDIKAQALNDLNKAMTAQVLIICNLGFEYKSQVLRDTVFSPLLVERNKKGLLTYFSSYLSLDELVEAYCKDRATSKLFTKFFDDLVDEYIINDVEYFD